ncbi:MAG TPA: sigma-70 family RNA polymerase sigma factor [Longimicrobiales bacterium]|nr:sigma-70 family RNA polymerase sigma factor [Longimicrobiales bacterium]
MAAMADEDDQALVARARLGEGAALDALVSRHSRAVYELAYRVLGDSDLAEDAAQDAFVRALRALKGFRGDASFRTWLLRIALNTARSAGRTRTRRGEVPLELVSETLGGDADPEREAVARTEAARAERALAALPEKQRLAVTLRLHQGLSHREIADLTDMSEGSARVNYHLGVKRLRELLK